MVAVIRRVRHGRDNAATIADDDVRTVAGVDLILVGAADQNVIAVPARDGVAALAA